MKHLFTFITAMVIFTACQNQPDNTVVNDSAIAKQSLPDTTVSKDSVKPVALKNGTTCFLYTKDKDTISMRLTLKDSVASGNLVYNFYEKDKNKGTFKGFLKNDTLLANYMFSSEGMRSVRQVVFLLKGDILLSGSGSMKDQYGRLIFSNKKDISFDNNLILKPVDCAKVIYK